MDLNIDPAAINKYVADKILESTLGDALRKVVDAEIVKLGRTYDSPLTKAVEQELQRHLMQMLNDEYAEKFKEAVRAHMTDEVVKKATDAAFDAFFDKIDRRR